MKIPSINRSNTNEFRLPPFKIIQTISRVQNIQRKFQSASTLPSLLLPTQKIIAPLRGSTSNTIWIHHHHRPTLLSRKNRILSVGLHPDYICYSQKYICLLLSICWKGSTHQHTGDHYAYAWVRVCVRIYISHLLNVINFYPHIRNTSSLESVLFSVFRATIGNCALIFCKYLFFLSFILPFFVRSTPTSYLLSISVFLFNSYDLWLSKENEKWGNGTKTTHHTDYRQRYRSAISKWKLFYQLSDKSFNGQLGIATHLHFLIDFNICLSHY